MFTVFIILGYSLEGSAGAIRDMPNLSSITFWEVTAGINAHTFAVNSSELTTRRTGALSISGANYDFIGSSTGAELFDVYYSDADGSFNIDGEFVSVEAVFDLELPFGGGFNLSKVEFNFTEGSSQYANSISSYLALGNNADEDTVMNAVDGNLNTYTSMGNTVGQSQRLRITVSQVPVSSAFWLLGSGIVGLAGTRIIRKKK